MGDMLNDNGLVNTECCYNSTLWSKTKAHITAEIGVALATKREGQVHKQHEINMTNVKPNATVANIPSLALGLMSGLQRFALGSQGVEMGPQRIVVGIGNVNFALVGGRNQCKAPERNIDIDV